MLRNCTSRFTKIHIHSYVAFFKKKITKQEFKLTKKTKANPTTNIILWR